MNTKLSNAKFVAKTLITFAMIDKNMITSKLRVLKFRVGFKCLSCLLVLLAFSKDVRHASEGNKHKLKLYFLQRDELGSGELVRNNGS